MTPAQVFAWWEALHPSTVGAGFLAAFVVVSYLVSLGAYLARGSRSQRARIDADRPHAWRGHRWYNRNN